MTGRVSVYNICRKDSVNGTIQPITGYADVNATDPAKLTVYFSGFGAPYWVLHIEGDYEQVRRAPRCSLC